MTTNYLRKKRGVKMRRGDDASEFKRQSMNAIKRRTILKKVTFISMMIIAFFMAIAVVLAYTIE